MALTALELKALNLERQVTTLLEQYTAVSNELIFETNAATKVLLQKQAEDLLQQYDQKQRELEQLTQNLKPAQLEQRQAGKLNSPQLQNRPYLHLEEHLPKIDFTKVTKLMSEIIRNEPLGEAAVFLLSDSYRMCGELCLKQVTRYLRDQSREPPQHIEIGFPAYETPTPAEFLRKLANYKQVATNANTDSLATAIIEKICSGLSTAGVVLIELKIQESLEELRGVRGLVSRLVLGAAGQPAAADRR